MVRMFVVIGTALALTVGGAASALGQGSATPTLKGTVGPGFTISLTKGGAKVKSLKVGTYKITVSDKATAHNFTLERETKPKIEYKLTSTAFSGTKSKTVALKKGSWKYYCSLHESMMHGTFTVK